MYLGKYARTEQDDEEIVIVLEAQGQKLLRRHDSECEHDCWGKEDPAFVLIYRRKVIEHALPVGHRHGSGVRSRILPKFPFSRDLERASFLSQCSASTFSYEYQDTLGNLFQSRSMFPAFAQSSIPLWYQCPHSQHERVPVRFFCWFVDKGADARVVFIVDEVS